MNKLLTFILVFFFISNISFAGTIDFNTLPKDSVLKDTVWSLKGFVKDDAKLWISPFKITGKRFCFWVPVIGVTMLSMANDEKIYSEFKKFQGKHEWVSDLSPILTKGGENYTVLATSGLFYFGGLIFQNEKAQQTGVMSVEALAHAGLIVTVGKLITGRQRPRYENGKDYWHWFPSTFKQFGRDPQSKYDAFPSGHSIAAWSIATVIAKQYSNYTIVPILAYTAATGVALSRITQDAHWMSDIIIGSALGYTIGSFVVRERKNTHWTLFPSSNGKGVFLTSTYKL